MPRFVPRNFDWISLPVLAQMRVWAAILLTAGALVLPAPSAQRAPERLRVIVETDLGGDPDDEQSMVRFLLYTCEWDVEGIIANRPRARDGENRNPVRTGLGIARRMLDAYAECYPNLRVHDPRYPTPEYLRSVTVPGYDDTEEGVRLVRAAAERRDPRPVWFMNWGTDAESGRSCLIRALEQVRKEKGDAGYARMKARFRLSSSDEFEEHTTTIQPPWTLWVDTFRPELEGRRWYHRFSGITATAGGFDIHRDVLNNHGPLGAMYPLNTTHPQKEGDTMSFLYLVPTGMNDPLHPEWGSWAGRYGPKPGAPAGYYWANQADAWEGTTHRDNSLRRWAAALQNDFRARMDWCVTKEYRDANHPPQPRVAGSLTRTVRSGREVRLDASGSRDPDGRPLRFRWLFYPEAGTYRGALPQIRGSDTARASFTAPAVEAEQTLHVLLVATDGGDPPLSRYRRVRITVRP